MRITFCGAAREVTGSCYLLEAEGKKILVDCGMFQGGNFNEGKNHDKFPFDPKEIDAVLVTHAHLDHIGRIPKLIKEGFKGRIWLTKGTGDFAVLIWTDAWHIMKEDNRRYATPILFDEGDIARSKAFCHGLNYHEEVEVFPGIKANWHDAGHIFGSAFISVKAEGKTIVFSGDVGNTNEPIVRDTETLIPADVLLIDSTYGDRVHETVDVRREIILKLLIEGVKKGGTIMIPAFSLERTQEFLYELNKLSEYDKTLPQVPIFLDSPLAIDATVIYGKYPEYYDDEAMRLHMMGDDFLDFPNLQKTHTREESKKINNIPGSKIIIAGSGMMNGGRIMHHAFRYLSDPASTLIIVGYQAQGTLGRRLYEGEKKVKMFGQKIDVKCTIKAIGALSAHADQKKLLSWVGGSLRLGSGQAGLPKKVFCVHGERKAAIELGYQIKKQLNVETYVPKENETIEI